MKKKLFTLMTLLLCLCSGAWAQHPTYSLIDGGAINTTHFLTTGTLIDGSNNSTYSKCVRLSGNVTSTTSLSTSANFIAYDVKTTKTVFTVYVYNSNSSSKDLYIHDVKEVLNSSNKATSSMTTVSIKSKTKDDTPVSYTSNNTGRATIYFSSAAASSAEFYQIIASEEGDPIDDATAGYVGYSLNLKYGRIATKTGETPSYDGIEFCTSSDYKPTSNTELKIKTFGTDYIKFTAAERCALFLTRTSGNYPYTLGSAKNVAGAIEYGASAAGTDKIVIEPGTYYINPKKDVTSERKITNIEFVPVYAINFAAGTGASGTMTTLYNYEGGKVTVPACSFNAPDGQVFDYWNVAGIDGTTEADPDDELTMPGNAITLTAIWRTEAVMHHVTYNLNGATAGTVPTQADVEEGQQFTVAAVPSDLEAPVGKEFSIWSDGTNNYAPGDPYTMGTSDVTLTAQYVNLKCSTPTITTSTTFNFANKGYPVTITNNEDGSTLYYSTNNVDWTEYTSALYATTTTHYYAKSVKASYDDSEVADKNVTNTFDSEKKYIAWVYKSGYTSASVAYNFETDPMVIGLKTTYNVVPVALADGDRPYTNRATDGIAINNADLVVCTEAVTGNTNLANDMKNFVGRNAMINLKLWNYGNGNGTQTRWGWGTVANNTTSFTFTPTSPTYKIFSGVTFEDGDVRVFESTAPKDNKLAYVNWTSEPANNVVMGSVSDKPTMHAIIDDANLKKQFFAIGLSRDNATSYSANAVTIIKNVAAMLIAGTERLDTEVATVSGTITASGWNTFSCSYALDLYTISGGTAYVATTTSNNSVTMTSTDAIVEAGTGLMIKGTPGEPFTINTTSETATFSGENLLVGLPNGGQVTANDNNYVFAWPTDTPSDYAFYFVDDFEPTLPAGKAYLQTTAPLNSKQLAIIFEGETTGISNLNVNDNANIDANAPVYNLAGQKVSKNYKGIVIVNGKKVVRK